MNSFAVFPLFLGGIFVTIVTILTFICIVVCLELGRDLGSRLATCSLGVGTLRAWLGIGLTALYVSCLWVFGLFLSGIRSTCSCSFWLLLCLNCTSFRQMSQVFLHICSLTLRLFLTKSLASVRWNRLRPLHTVGVLGASGFNLWWDIDKLFVLFWGDHLVSYRRELRSSKVDCSSFF